MGCISVTKGKQSARERQGKGLSLRVARQEQQTREERQPQTEEEQIKESQGQPAWQTLYSSNVGSLKRGEEKNKPGWIRNPVWETLTSFFYLHQTTSAWNLGSRQRLDGEAMMWWALWLLYWVALILPDEGVTIENLLAWKQQHNSCILHFRSLNNFHIYNKIQLWGGGTLQMDVINTFNTFINKVTLYFKVQFLLLTNH